MRLLALEIENFRSYKERVSVDIGDFTALIGKNDVGKSTILEALEIFFNHQLVKLDQHDPCVHGDNKIVEISCIFDDFPERLTIDAKSVTNLIDEHLLNADGNLEIVKRFDCRTKTPKEEVFARALHPSHEAVADVLKLKNAELKARAKELAIDLADVDQRSNTALRAAIRTCSGTDRAIALIPMAEEDGRKVWDQLQKHLPLFALFQADRPSKDDDPEVADPMKIAVAAAVKEVESDLEAIRLKVQQSAIGVARRTLDKLREMDPELARQLNPTFKAEPKWDGFKLTLTGDDDIPINKRGSGVRRLILLNFFRAEAERRRDLAATQRVIYAIEEPESSQHPDNQIMLVKALVALGDEPHTQVLMTTHVPAIAAVVPTESIRLVSRGEAGLQVVEAGNDQVYETVAASLGVLSDKRAKVVIFVEGPHDVSFLTHVSRVYRTHDASLLDLDGDYRIVFVPTGGGNLKHWVDQRYLRNAGLVEVHIYDADEAQSPKYAAQVETVNGRGGPDVAFLTKRREMENYLHPQCIADEYQLQVTFTDWCDVPALVAEATHSASESPNAWAQLGDDKRSEKSSRAKRRLNTSVVARMTLAQVQQVDAHGEMLGWFQAIRDRAA